MSRNDRGLAIGTIVFIAVIAIAALLYALMNPGVTGVIDVSSAATDSSDAQGHIDTLETIWGLILFYALLLGAVFIISRSVFESRRGI